MAGLGREGEAALKTKSRIGMPRIPMTGSEHRVRGAAKSAPVPAAEGASAFP